MPGPLAQRLVGGIEEVADDSQAEPRCHEPPEHPVVKQPAEENAPDHRLVRPALSELLLQHCNPLLKCFCVRPFAPLQRL